MMKAEFEELKNILASQQESAEGGFLNRVKELKSREVYFPVLMMMLMFSLQVNSHCLDWNLDDQKTRRTSDNGFIIKK